MSRAVQTYPESWSVADLLEQLGGIDPRRIRMRPLPGTATENDVLRIQQREDRLFELVEGVLVEKSMAYREGYLAMEIGGELRSFANAQDLGLVAGADAMVRIMIGLVRIPDVSFVSWKRLPSKMVPDEPIPDLVPELAVEVLSEGNTPAEMRRKLKEYFLAGVELVWFVDPETRTVRVFTAPDELKLLRERQTLDGGGVLPGFRLALSDLFRRLSSSAKKAPRRSRKSRE